MSTKLKILFIGHDASRTGAPIVLLHLIRWMKQRADVEFCILLKDGGELEEEYRSLGKTFIWNKNTSASGKKSLREKIGFRKAKDTNPIKEFLHSFKPHVIHANTVVTTDIAIELKNICGAPVVCHLHELEVAINRYFGRDNFLAIRENVDHYIAVSEAVKNNLLDNHNIKKERITKINEFVPSVEYSEAKLSLRKDIHQELGIPDDAFIVGGSGTLDWRKSPDLFVQIAATVQKMKPSAPIHFLWIGGDLNGYEYRQLEHDIKLLEIKNIHFPGVKTNPIQYFNCFDVFLLTSREDPFPLVCLEAASLGKPIICFDKAGGMPEFVEEDAGFIVPFMDIETPAKKILLLEEDKALHKKLGDLACEKVKDRHDSNKTSAIILQFLKDQFMGQ